jgi:hypothetical protein
MSKHYVVIVMHRTCFLFYVMCSREYKARTQCPMCPNPQTMLPRHLHKVHGVPLNEIDALLPSTYRRRTRSERERDEATINDDDDDEEEVDDEEEMDDQSDEVQSSEEDEPAEMPPVAQEVQGPQPLLMTVEDMVAALHTSPPPSPGPRINPGVRQAAAAAITPTGPAVRIPIVLVNR